VFLRIEKYRRNDVDPPPETKPNSPDIMPP
jgi:hypothetical protein